MAAIPFGASSEDTGEFMLGDVYVTVVAFESDGSRDVSTEDWNEEYRDQVKLNVENGLAWWQDSLAEITDKHALNFQIDFTYLDAPIATGYEPISRPSYDFQLWMYDFLDDVGFNQSGNFSTDIRAFNHAQRMANETHWAFTIFVVNDQNDPDGRFAPGSFDRAFAYAGGRFFISPAGRPDSTFTHETGHMFWARDEYAGGGTYNSFRGYYNTQNTNAWDNPAFTSQADREPSIMDRGACEEGGGLLCDAFLDFTSSQSSLEMIGWRDSDADGVFDVLDVPHELTGSGSFDATIGAYRFTGQSTVQTLPNLNSSGPQNDITIATISRAEYRIDGGAWQSAATYDEYSAAIDLTIPMSAGSTIEIRTIDDITGITSPIFAGGTDRPSKTLLTGLNGLVWNDLDADGEREPLENGLAGWTVQLVDDQGDPIMLRKGVEPDDYPNTNTLLNTVIPEATLSSVGFGVSDNSVFSVNRGTASTGGRVFAAFSASCGGYCTEWTEETRQLRVDFTSPTSTVSIDAIGRLAGDQARLEVFDASNQLLARYTTAELASGAFETMTLDRSEGDIAYAIARAHGDSTVQFDNLQFGPQSSVVTDADGFFAFGYLPVGDYTVAATPMSGMVATSPASATRQATLSAGEAVDGIDFGFGMSEAPHQNPANRFDVNNDGIVSPFDALNVINDLNANGTREPVGEAPPPFRDVNGDGFITPNDVLQIINYLNSNPSGEAESGSGLVFGPMRGFAGNSPADASRAPDASVPNADGPEAESASGAALDAVVARFARRDARNSAHEPSAFRPDDGPQTWHTSTGDVLDVDLLDLLAQSTLRTR